MQDLTAKPPHDAFASWQSAALDLASFCDLDRPTSQLIGPAQARYLLAFSLLAPSSHNTVPQAYRLDLAQDCIELWLRRRYVLPASDPTGREALTSLGCALENLAVAAAQYGLASDWQVAPELRWASVPAATSQDELRVGRLRLSRAEVPDDASRLAALAGISRRQMLRAEFDPSQRLPAELRSRLLGLSTDSVRVLLFESDVERFAWGKLDELALKHKLEESAFRRELGQWILPNEDSQSPRGMRGREFGLDDRVTRELAARLRGEAAMPVDQLAFMARAGRIGLCSASAVCVLSCLQPDPATAITAGRLFQRCALLALGSGLACAVHTAVCQVGHARAMSEATLMKSLTPSLIFRLGRPRQGSDGLPPHSARPPLDDVLIG